jgi:flagellar biogenesis protein FliO
MFRALILASGLFLVVILGSRCFAQDPGEALRAKEEKAASESMTYVPPSWPEGPDAETMLLRIGVGTALVVSLCLATMWLLGRKFPVGALKKQTGNRLRVIATLPLANRGVLHLLTVERRRIVAAVDSTGLKALLPIPETSEPT